jgi:uroporphyrinogen decarboxylase
MDKIQRVRATLAGQPVDHPPFTVWYHFGTQHAPAERAATAHLEFFEAYDLDLLKVMNDYDYPMPDGIDTIATAADLELLRPFEPRDTPMAAQLEAIEIIARALSGKALFVDTVFNAWNTLKRNLAKGAIAELMTTHPAAVEDALRVVNANLIQYARTSLERGAAGIFLSVPASAEALTLEQFERFMRPFDLELLDAIRDRGECHILHAHGERLYLDRLLDYPVHALSWSDLNGGPRIADARKRTGLTLMAGLDHARFTDMSADAVRTQVRAARLEGGPSKFILAPGCSLPTFAFPPLIRAARDAVAG